MEYTFVDIGSTRRMVCTAARIAMDHRIPMHPSPTHTQLGCPGTGPERDATDIGFLAIGNIDRSQGQSVKKNT